MCRWMAYIGNPIALDEFILKTDHSLIDQSMSAKLSPKPTNGDGFGIGWYNSAGEPGVYRSTQPAWNDANLRDLTHHVDSGMFLAHVRRSTGTAVQQSNCHPFRHGNWLFVHNGLIYGLEDIRREMMLEIDPSLFTEIRGSADSELMFYLALTYGLEEEPIRAVERMVGLVERLAKDAGVDESMQMTVGISDGNRLWTIRYSSMGESRSLFYTSDVSALRELYPDNPRLDVVGDNARIVTSEPTSDRAGVWNEVPEATALYLEGHTFHHRPFMPVSV